MYALISSSFRCQLLLDISRFDIKLDTFATTYENMPTPQSSTSRV
ncbi:MAG TPA: hypothetical protein PL077_04355 [Treponemataceae bacterium]|nr:hypothetical protein [Treponemataceae bacterium]